MGLASARARAGRIGLADADTLRWRALEVMIGRKLLAV